MSCFALWPVCCGTASSSDLSLGKGFLADLSGIAHILVVHPDVAERNVLQCLGYPSEGMERVYTQDNYSACHRTWQCLIISSIPATVAGESLNTYL